MGSEIEEEGKVDFTHVFEPRSLEGYWIQSLGLFTSFSEIGKEGSVTIYERTLNGEGRRERN